MLVRSHLKPLGPLLAQASLDALCLRETASPPPTPTAEGAGGHALGGAGGLLGEMMVRLLKLSREEWWSAVVEEEEDCCLQASAVRVSLALLLRLLVLSRQIHLFRLC